MSRTPARLTWRRRYAGARRRCAPFATASCTISASADCVADAEWVRDEIRKAYPQVGEITITALGVVIGAHCGPGLLTVFYLCNGRQPK